MAETVNQLSDILLEIFKLTGVMQLAIHISLTLSDRRDGRPMPGSDELDENLFFIVTQYDRLHGLLESNDSVEVLKFKNFGLITSALGPLLDRSVAYMKDADAQEFIGREQSFEEAASRLGKPFKTQRYLG